MINFHPSDKILENFAAANLSAGLALAVATHLDYCPLCRQTVQEYERAHAESLLAEAPLVVDESFDNMLADILNTEPTNINVNFSQQELKSSFIKLEQQKYVLPASLKPFYLKNSRWRKLSGVQTNKLGEYDDFRANLLYIEANTNVPMHTHKSLEITVVLAGTLCDEQGQYYPGDFIVLDNNITHSPATKDGQSCLCLAVMDAPVQFTQGAARLLNPFAHLMY
ncbi:ChrR family anti-sigma-E factor [Catenovulum sp. 2E275]|uniref:ChrR family anti-sigma-E factor n=1 Tax=Catenovulum sp. 2E275 TaxID=2980497 RepID=UPI0021CE5154|nr:ChrR family anti-sigma-E factor [Catenovulum sp. 2E275]MCU4674281.1 ChrR family anti-sigma-E factor [Catenovulum sp. 2E275]